MAPSNRAEQRLMRQRGGAAREVKNKAFNFSIGLGPLQPRASSRRTPQPTPGRRQTSRTPRAGPSSTARKTPATKKKTPATSKATHSESTATTSEKEQTATSKAKTPGTGKEKPQTFTTPSVTGKRKRGPVEAPLQSQSDEDELERDDEAHVPSSQAAVRSSARSSTRRTSGNRIRIEDVEDDLNQNDENHVLSSGKTSRGSSNKLRGRLQDSQESITPSQRPKSSRRKALQVLEDLNGPSSFVQTTPMRTQRKGPAQKIASEQETDESMPTKEPRQISQKQPASTTKRKVSQRSARQEIAEESEEDELRGESPQANDHQDLKPRPKPATAKKIASASSQREAETQPQAQRLPFKAPSKSSSGPSTRRPSSNSEAQKTKKRSAQVTKKSNNQPKANKNRQPAETEDEERSSKRKKTQDESVPVPVTVYRLSNPRKDSAFEDEEDPLAGPTPDVKLPFVNPIDVFAQISSEISNRYHASLGRQLQRGSLDAGQRAEVKRKQAVVQQFVNRLSDRLFELTEAVDAGAVLRKRLRQVVREQDGLREEFLGIRRQRDEIALQMDAEREQHRQRVALRRSQDELSVAMFDIELAVKRGKQMARGAGGGDKGPAEPLGMLLQSVARDTSSRDISGGLFQKVKGFNEFLERAVVMFEGRN